MKFAYPRLHYVIRSCFLFALLASMAAFTIAFSDISLFWPLVLIFIFAIFILLTNVSPLFTGHEINADGIILRNGMLFRARIPLGQIEKIERSRPRWKFKKIVLASGSSGLVLIKLKSEIRFKALLFRSSDEIIIDLVRPDEFVRLANEKLSQIGLSPVNSDGPGPELGN